MLKILRRIVQWSFFFIFTVGFLSFMPESTSGWSALLPRLQFFPAIKRFPAFALIVLLLTFLFGRIYCSTLCPLATVQDLFIGKKRRFSYRKPAVHMRYLIPAISIAALFAGFPALASAVDPYSVTGRIISSLNELIILPLIDLAGYILRYFSIYITTYPIQFRWITIAAAIISAVLIFLLSRTGGRLYCNSLCPVGAILSIPARWALFAHRIDVEKCTSCGVCERVCKAEAISSSLKCIDTSRCVSCFNCSDVCSFDALKFGRKIKSVPVASGQGSSAAGDPGGRGRLSKPGGAGDRADGRRKKPAGPEAQGRLGQFDSPDGPGGPGGPGGAESKADGRREFLKKTTFGSMLLLGLPVLVRAQSPDGSAGGASSAAVPPGAGSRSAFLSKCVSCSLCISRCPGNVLQPAAVSQYGLKGIGVPFMDFNRGSCAYECTLCTELCPSGAIRPLDVETKKRVKIGEAEFVREFCVVETDGTSCGACGEICPNGAIDMVHIGDSPEGALEIPVLYKKYCIGCGACQFVCPVEAKNAIYVRPLEPHSRAEMREAASGAAPEDVNNDFAF